MLVLSLALIHSLDIQISAAASAPLAANEAKTLMIRSCIFNRPNDRASPAAAGRQQAAAVGWMRC